MSNIINRGRYLHSGFIICILATIFTGCASTSPSFTAAPAPEVGTGLVYFYRVDLDPSLRRISVKLDDSLLFRPKEGEYTWAHLPEGKHLVQIHWPDSMDHAPNLEFDLIVESGDVRFIQLTGKSDQSVYNELLLKNEAIVQNSSDGSAAVGECCGFVEPDDNFVSSEGELLIGRSKDIDVGVRHSKTRLIRF